MPILFTLLAFYFVNPRRKAQFSCSRSEYFDIRTIECGYQPGYCGVRFLSRLKTTWLWSINIVIKLSHLFILYCNNLFSSHLHEILNLTRCGWLIDNLKIVALFYFVPMTIVWNYNLQLHHSNLESALNLKK